MNKEISAELLNELLVRLLGIQEDHVGVSRHEPGAEFRVVGGGSHQANDLKVLLSSVEGWFTCNR